MDHEEIYRELEAEKAEFDKMYPFEFEGITGQTATSMFDTFTMPEMDSSSSSGSCSTSSIFEEIVMEPLKEHKGIEIIPSSTEWRLRVLGDSGEEESGRILEPITFNPQRDFY
jgi:hypothetical protein